MRAGEAGRGGKSALRTAAIPGIIAMPRGTHKDENAQTSCLPAGWQPSLMKTGFRSRAFSHRTGCYKSIFVVNAKSPEGQAARHSARFAFAAWRLRAAAFVHFHGDRFAGVAPAWRSNAPRSLSCTSRTARWLSYCWQAAHARTKLRPAGLPPVDKSPPECRPPTPCLATDHVHRFRSQRRDGASPHA